MNLDFNSSRLKYRSFLNTDLEDMYELDSDPDVHIYLGNNPVTTKKQSEDIIANIQQQYIDNNIGRCAIILKETGEFIGWSGLKLEGTLRPEFKYYDIGYRLKKKFWGNGYATEAAMASLKYGFQEMKLDQICGAADVNNLASNHILAKIGMTKKEPFVFQGVTCNWYEVTREEWKELQS